MARLHSQNGLLPMFGFTQSEPSSRNTAQLAREILAYLTDHPDARDTLDGITEWWFLEQEIKRRMAEVKGALTELVAKGLVLEQRGKDTQIHYRVNKRKWGAIHALLQTKDEEQQ